MELFLTALLILLAATVPQLLLAVLAAERPDSGLVCRTSNVLGSGLSAAGCLTGLFALASGPWDEILYAELPWGLPFGQLTLGLDPLTRIFLLPVFGLGLTCALMGGISLRHTSPREHNLGAHWFFFLLLLLGMACVLSARDAVLFMLSWEIMSLSPFFLIDFNDGDRKVRDASWVYLVAGHLGAVALMAFFILLWDTTGTTSLSVLEGGSALAGCGEGLLTTLFILAVLGFGAKAGLAPLHVWLPEAHPAAPSHVSALMSGAMINAGLYGVIRTVGILAAPGEAPEAWGWGLLLLGLFTGLLGILKALGQNNLKRLLAYSSVENMGLMVMGLGAGLIGQACGNTWIAVLGLTGCLLHMINHAGFKGLLFLCAGEVLHSTGTLRMELLGGLQKRLPLLGALFALGAASIACLPPFSGFAGEFTLILSLLDGPALSGVEREIGLLLVLTGLALISGLAAAVYCKAYGTTFLGEPRSGFAEKPHHTGFSTMWPLLVPVAACVCGGLMAPRFFDLASLTAVTALPLAEELAAEIADVQAQVTGSLSMVSMAGGILVVLAAVCFLVRKALLSGKDDPTADGVGTWGCGFQRGTARIQYTDASFAEPLAKVFGFFMGVKLNREKVTGLFPENRHLAVSAPDRLMQGVFTPLFEGIERLCNAGKIIQHGKIHLYILYILATVIGLLIWGLN